MELWQRFHFPWFFDHGDLQKHLRITARTPGRIDFGTPLQPSHLRSICPLSIGADGYGRHVPAVIDMLV